MSWQHSSCDAHAVHIAAATLGPELHHTVSIAPLSPAAGKGAPAEGTDTAGHGLEAVAEMLGQIVSLIASDAVGTHTDMDEFGLDLMNAALNAGGSGVPHILPISVHQSVQVCIWASMISQNLFRFALMHAALNAGGSGMLLSG